MKFTEKDIQYMERKKALRIRNNKMEDIILHCLETGKFKQGRDIVDIVLAFYPEEFPRNILRMIYKIVGIDLKWLPENYEEDMILL